MSPRLLSSHIIAITAIIAIPSPAVTQRVSPTLVGAGSGFVLIRPGDRWLWGVQGRVQSYLAPAAIARGVATLEFLRSDGFATPLIASVGGAIGMSLPGRDAGVTSPLTLGLTLFYFAAGRDLFNDCFQGTCQQRNNGYDLGFMLAAAATWGLEYRVGAESVFYTEFRLHVPTGLGSNGFAGDPSAAFVGFAIGFLVAR